MGRFRDYNRSTHKGDGIVRTVKKFTERNRNDFAIAYLSKSNKIDATSQWASNQNVNATSIGVERVVIFVKELRKLRETLIETIRSQAKYNLEGSETIIGASDQVNIGDDGIVRPLWRHRELTRDELALAA